MRKDIVFKSLGRKGSKGKENLKLNSQIKEKKTSRSERLRFASVTSVVHKQHSYSCTCDANRLVCTPVEKCTASAIMLNVIL